MGSIGERKTIAVLAGIVLLGVLALPAIAGDTIPVRAVLVTDCGSGCQTDAGGWSLVNQTWIWNGSGAYSLLPDLHGEYLPSSVFPVVESNILTHNTVFTLDTTGTLVDGQVVVPPTRTVEMHFFTTGGNAPPDCWANSPSPNDAHNQTQAVNWSLFSQNSTAFTEMAIYDPANPKTVYAGFARLDFNVRNSECDRNIYRFYLKWQLPNKRTSSGGGGITIKRLSAGQWEITTDPYGTASLFGQGGKSGQTQPFGDWRMPFQIILTQLP